MAQGKNYIALSFFLGVFYALFGYFSAWESLEVCLLAFMIFLIIGVLLDINGSEGPSSRELGGLLAALTPLLVVTNFPEIREGGTVRLALAIIASYTLARFLFSRFINKWTSHNGLVHSLPASIIAFQITILALYDLHWESRLYLAGASFIGYFAQLLADGSGNIDFISVAAGEKAKNKGPVISMGGANTFSTLLAYGTIFLLGWMIINDNTFPLGLAVHSLLPG